MAASSNLSLSSSLSHNSTCNDVCRPITVSDCEECSRFPRLCHMLGNAIAWMPQKCCHWISDGWRSCTETRLRNLWVHVEEGGEGGGPGLGTMWCIEAWHTVSWDRKCHLCRVNIQTQTGHPARVIGSMRQPKLEKKRATFLSLKLTTFTVQN